MSVSFKLFTLVLLGSIGIYSVSALGATPTSSDSLYSESLTLQRSSAEIPSSIDSNTAKAAVEESDYVIESVGDLDDAPAPAAAPKKVSSNKGKRTIKN